MDDEDETEVTLSVEWSEDALPQKKKTTLQKILQTWASKSRFNGDCTVLKVSEDGRAVIKIKPAAAVTELQNLRGQTLIGRDRRTVIIMSVSPKLTELTTQTPDNASMTPPPSFGSEPQHVKGQHEEESNMMASTHTDNASVDLQQVKKQLSEQSNMTASTFNIPMHHYWYVNHAYQEEIKRLEKASGTKITAEVKLTFEAQQKDGNPDNAFSEFANLVQKCSAESRGFSVPLDAVNAEGWTDTVKIIQRPENKLLVALSSEEMTVCGPRQSQDAIRKSLKAARKAAGSTQASPDASLNTADPSKKPSTSCDGKAEDEDEVQVLLSVKWSEGSQPQKCKLDLQKALRTWDSNRGQARNKARDYTVLKVSEDGRAVIRIKPSPAVSELQQLSGQTLKGTDGKIVTITSVSLTLAELEGQTPDKTSGSKPQHVKGQYRERYVPKSTFNVPKHTDSASVNPPPSSVSEPQCDQVPRWRQSRSSSSAAASPTEEKTSTCQVPVRHFWDMNHILKEEIKHIGRVNRVQMNAAVHVTLEGSKKNEKCLVSTRPLLYRPSGLSTRNTEAPREEGATGGDKEDENCPICRDRFTKKKQLKCKHEFCEECLEQSIKHLGSTCPVCKDVFGMVEGNQPDGTMSVYKSPSSLPRFEDCSTVINDSYFLNDKPDRPEMNAEPGHSARNTEAPREEGATAGDKEDENCPICRDRFTKKKQLKCKHEFCEECLEQSIKHLGSTCPVCKDVFGMVEGNQPDGTMSVYKSPSSLPGFEDCGTVINDSYFLNDKPGRPEMNAELGHSARNTEAPREEGATAGDKEDENCPICRDRFTKKKQLKCKHEFCEECLEKSIKHLGSTCPVCKDVFGMVEGNQPDGTMSVYKSPSSLPGFEDCGTVINDSYFLNDKPGRPEMNAELGHSARNTEAPREEGATAGDKEDENCPICRDRFTKKKQLKCKHEFCEECLEKSIKHLGSTCPVCKDVFGMIEGNQPEGTMSSRSYFSSLPGFPDCRTIVIDYYFPSGKQTEKHPNPGQNYHGTSRTAYLPDNKEGKEVLRLLERAFKQKLTFTVGRSTTTGRENQVIWSDIHHKTSTHGGPQSFGFPDPDYLRRVREELKAKGIK